MFFWRTNRNKRLRSAIDEIILAVKLKMITQERMSFGDFSVNVLSWNFGKAIFYSNPNSLENFCEKQWRHSVKRRLYKTPSPILHSVKLSWRHSVKTRLYRSPPLYFVVLASSVKIKEVKVIEFRRIAYFKRYTIWHVINLNYDVPL